MKQNISVDQLNELSDKGKERLRNWWKEEVGDKYFDGKFIRIVPDDEGKIHVPIRQLPLLSIGQMIELIGHKRLNVIQTWDKGWYRVVCYEYVPIKPMKAKELCDALWLVTERLVENYSIEL